MPLRWLLRRLLLSAVSLFAGATLPVRTASAQPATAPSRPLVYVIPIDGTIDMGLAPFVQRVLDDAAAERAAAVVLEINTFGGRVDAAVAIRDALLAARIPTVAFVNRRAISAGALIALATNRIVMATGGTIGAATPVQMGQPGAAPTPVDEKTVSYVRKEFRATAESRGRPLEIAEAMVDSDVEIPGIIAKGKLLTLTTEEALANDVANARANSIDELLEQMQLSGALIERVTLNWGERLVRLITHPVIASLLLSVAVLGILIEIRTPGFGVPGGLGIGALMLLLGGHYVVQLVGWEELLLVSAGLSLLALEIFVIPGFGVAGIVGILALLSGVTMGLVGQGATTLAMLYALSRVGMALVVSVVIAMIAMRYLPRSRMGRRLMLETELPSGSGVELARPDDDRWMGRVGHASSALRPAGIADLDGERVDVVSEGEMIDAGAAIVVSRVDGNRIVVRRRRTATEEFARD